MDQYGASTAIFGKWLAEWPTLHPSIPFTFDNDNAPEAPTFARVGIKSLDSEHWTLGKPGDQLQRRPGYIDVRLTDQSDTGRKLLDQLVGSVRAIYERKRFASGFGEDGVITHAANVSELTRDRDGPQLWIVQVLVPFEFYETI